MDDLDLGATIKGFSPGQKAFGRYTLAKMLGRGGMGVVWLAKDDELGRDTALKFLPEVVSTDRAAIDDMKREVRRAIDLAHPNIVKIHDFVTDGRTAAVSMEHVAGSTLSSLRVDEPARCFSHSRLEDWVRQLCAALDYAHGEAEVVHRDLKPANLMIDARGRLKVLDFGIAASLSDSVSRVSKQAGASGTPVYMSPQQMMGEKPAATDDLYSMGATLYELLTGKPPFHSGNILLQVQNKVPPLIAERRKEFGITMEPPPQAWEDIIAALLAKDAKDRPQSAGEVAERLGLIRISTAPPSKASPPAAVSVAVATISVPRQAQHAIPAADPQVTLKIAGIIGLAVAAGALSGWAYGGFNPDALLQNLLSGLGFGLLVLRRGAGWPVLMIKAVLGIFSALMIYARIADPTYIVLNVARLALYGFGWWVWSNRAPEFGRLGTKWLAICIGQLAVVTVGGLLLLPSGPSAMDRVVFFGMIGGDLLAVFLLAKRKLDGWLVLLLLVVVSLTRVATQTAVPVSITTVLVASRMVDLVLYGWGWFAWRRAEPARTQPIRFLDEPAKTGTA